MPILGTLPHDSNRFVVATPSWGGRVLWFIAQRSCDAFSGAGLPGYSVDLLSMFVALAWQIRHVRIAKR